MEEEQKADSSMEVERRIGTSDRRRARELALQALYEVEFAKHEPEETLQRLAQESVPAPDPDLVEFIRELVLGVLESSDRLDTAIQSFAPAWPVRELAAVDKCILRMGVFEIWLKKVPAKVAINEAVELAKGFGGDGSAKFINGVLGSVYASVSKE